MITIWSQSDEKSRVIAFVCIHKIACNTHEKNQDIIYPKSKYCNSNGLHNLAIAHGLPIISFHRALSDCQTLVNLLALVPDLKIQLAKASRPKVLVKSLEQKPGTLSRKHGFRWNSIIPLSWAKYMPEEDISLLPFKVVKIHS